MDLPDRCLAIAGLCVAFAVTPAMAQKGGSIELKRENYQKEIDGKKVDLYTIRNSNGMVVKITNWGAK